MKPEPYKLSESQRLEIEIIVKWLKNSVTSLQVAEWLGNFKPTEYEMALWLLKHIEYITNEELVALLDRNLQKILSAVDPTAPIIVNSIGEYGKSGTMLIYYFKKTPVYQNNKGRISFYENAIVFEQKRKDDLVSPNSTIIFLDDFLGSGKSFYDYYKLSVKPHIQGYGKITKIFVLCIFHLKKAANLLMKYTPEVKLIGEARNAAFSSKGSVFGYRYHFLKLRDMCYDYGEELFSVLDRKKKKYIPYPLGYENSQALIVFPYGPPNNTLPVIWSSRKTKNVNWIPLFPRSTAVKIEEAREFRKDMAFKLSLIRHTHAGMFFRSGFQDLGWKKFHFITQTDFLLFTVIFLKRKRRPIPIICQLLGITEHEYSDIVKSGTADDLFDSNGEVTAHGTEVYLEVLKSLRYFRRELKWRERNFKMRNIVYIPTSFNGRT
jgi:hypothetical protein